jgi:hypothetical protein
MKWIAFILCILLQGLSYGQGFSLAELEQMPDMKWASYKKLVTGKGYVVEKDTRDDMDHDVVYALGEASADEHNLHRVNHIEKQVSYDNVESDPEEITVSFITYSQQEVDAIRKQLKTSKFKFVPWKRPHEFLGESDWEVYNDDYRELTIMSARATSWTGDKDMSPFPYVIKLVKKCKVYVPYFQNK